jgi:hypothetical protein
MFDVWMAIQVFGGAFLLWFSAYLPYRQRKQRQKQLELKQWMELKK